jgi:hypothetical protein
VKADGKQKTPYSRHPWGKEPDLHPKFEDGKSRQGDGLLRLWSWRSGKNASQTPRNITSYDISGQGRAIESYPNMTQSLAAAAD